MSLTGFPPLFDQELSQKMTWWVLRRLEPKWRFSQFSCLICYSPTEAMTLPGPSLGPGRPFPKQPFGSIIHDRKWRHHGIKGKTWNPKEAITLVFNCVSSKCHSPPADVWGSSTLPLICGYCHSIKQNHISNQNIWIHSMLSTKLGSKCKQGRCFMTHTVNIL